MSDVLLQCELCRQSMRTEFSVVFGYKRDLGLYPVDLEEGQLPWQGLRCICLTCAKTVSSQVVAVCGVG